MIGPDAHEYPALSGPWQSSLPLLRPHHLLITKMMLRLVLRTRPRLSSQTLCSARPVRLFAKDSAAAKAASDAAIRAKESVNAAKKAADNWQKAAEEAKKAAHDMNAANDDAAKKA